MIFKNQLILYVTLFQCYQVWALFLVVPEDVPTGSAAIYGFAPKLVKGNDHRFGFGFRFGNHADFQILYEFGPQTRTIPLKPSRTRSAVYQKRTMRRRPFIDFLIESGLLKEISYRYNVIHNMKECIDKTI